jgi:hypothetical protein
VRKIWLFVVMFLLMHCVAFTWKVMPMSQEELTMFYDNRWAITMVVSALCWIAGALIAKGDD